MSEIFSISKSIDTIVARSEDAESLPLPLVEVRQYMDAIKNAYSTAGLDPEPIDRTEPYCPGAYDNYHSVLQVGYAKSQKTGNERGSFTARTSTGSIALLGIIVVANGNFRESQATLFDVTRTGPELREAVELTEGNDGSLASVIDMISKCTQAGEFRRWVPEPHIASLYRIRDGFSPDI